jgi:hypothetical protein
MRTVIESGLVQRLDAAIVRELLDAHAEAKRNYYLGGLRLSGVEGGRFCEAAFRLLQQRCLGTFDPLGVQLDTERLIRSFMQLPAVAQPDSIRLHIPRALRVVYDIRNRRDVAHLADGIDPNLQDASVVISVIDWVLAEFVRLYHNVPAAEAQALVASIVTRSSPAVEDFNGYLKVLRTDLGASDYVLLLLYQRGGTGARCEELDAWVRPTMRANLRRTLSTLSTLEHGKAYIHCNGGVYLITQSGIRYAEQKRLFDAT